MPSCSFPVEINYQLFGKVLSSLLAFSSVLARVESIRTTENNINGHDYKQSSRHHKGSSNIQQRWQTAYLRGEKVYKDICLSTSEAYIYTILWFKIVYVICL